MSYCATAMVAPKIAVIAPTQVTTCSATVGVIEAGVGAHQRIDARDQKDASGDHGGRVDQRADGGGAFHRVGQPDVQRDLAGLSRRAAEDQQRDGCRGRESERCGRCDEVGERGLLEAPGAAIVEEQRAACA
jgi:hypothetical protein